MGKLYHKVSGIFDQHVNFWLKLLMKEPGMVSIKRTSHVARPPKQLQRDLDSEQTETARLICWRSCCRKADGVGRSRHFTSSWCSRRVAVLNLNLSYGEMHATILYRVPTCSNVKSFNYHSILYHSFNSLLAGTSHILELVVVGCHLEFPHADKAHKEDSRKYSFDTWELGVTCRPPDPMISQS